MRKSGAIVLSVLGLAVAAGLGGCKHRGDQARDSDDGQHIHVDAPHTGVDIQVPKHDEPKVHVNVD